MNMKDLRDARSATSRRRGQSLALILLGAALLLMLAACAPAAAPAAPATQPTAAPAATATTAPRPTDKPAATATEAPKPTEKPAATATEAPKATEKPAATATQAAAPAAKAASVSFAKDVLPILQQNCVKCHGGDKTEVSLVLKDYTGVMAGSENGPVVVPGDASQSDFVRLVANGKMPKRANRLPDAQIKILTDWVNAGAPNN
jgi:mono/diheme cytochrome c family protein